jgi:hypothetical protein
MMRGYVMGELIQFFHRDHGSDVVRNLKEEIKQLIKKMEHKDIELLDAEIVYSVILLLEYFRPNESENIFEQIRKDTPLSEICNGDEHSLINVFLSLNEYWKIPFLKSQLKKKEFISTYKKISDFYGHILEHISISDGEWHHTKWGLPKVKDDEIYSHDGTGQMVFKCFPKKCRVELWKRSEGVYFTYSSEEKTMKIYDKLLEFDVDHTLDYIDRTFHPIE